MPYAVAAIGGALISADAAKSAAKTQAQAGDRAIDSQERMLASQQAINQPYTDAGVSALDRLTKGIAQGGEFSTPFKMEESQAQKFATNEAMAKMQSQMAVGGQGLSSNAIAGAGKLAGDIGSQYEQQAYNQWLTSRQQELDPLQRIASLGQASASGQAANIGQAGTNISNLQTGIGNAQAAGQVGAANAYSGAANSVSQYMMLQNLMSNNSSGSSGGSGMTAAQLMATNQGGSSQMNYQPLSYGSYGGNYGN